ncbi:MAG: hypothetical protein JW931_07150 [Methanomicrobiaceae archaeon]|nr:hypothetical protein [Methanomicrobiaceae archaeon]
MRGLANIIFHEPRLIAILPAAGIIMDYSLTFIFAGGREMIMMYEYSPIMRYSAAMGLIIPTMLIIAGFYYIITNTGLKALSNSNIYPFGVAIAVIVTLTHIMGGFSWIIKNQIYTYTIHGMSLMTIIIAFTAFLYSVMLDKGFINHKYIQ